MKSVFRDACIMILVFTAAFIVTGCAKRPPAAERVAPPSALTEQEMKKIIVAKVNGVELSMDALVKMMNIMMSAKSPIVSSSEPREETRKRALDQLVLQELALQAAARQGVRVKQRDLDAAISYLVGHEQKDYDAFLAKQNFTDAEFRSTLERSLLLQLILAREVTEKAVVSEDDARKEYERRKDLFIEPEKVAVVDVAISPKLDDQASMKKAAEIVARINADKDKNPWGLSPDGSFIVRDLDLKKETEPALYDAARKLKEGELSGAIKAGDGVHILKLSEYTPERQLSYEEVKGPLTGKLKADAQKKRRGEWERELKKDAKIEILDVPMPQEQKKP